MSDTMSRVSLDGNQTVPLVSAHFRLTSYLVNTTGTGSLAAGISDWGEDSESPIAKDGSQSPDSDAFHSPDEDAIL
jgi:hypothetical protein